VLEVLARMKDASARGALRDIAADAKTADAQRLKAIDLLRQVRDPRSEEVFLELLASAKSDALRVGLLAGLEAFEDASVGEKVLARYPTFSPAVKKRAVQFMFTRPTWALMLLRHIDSGRFPQADVSVESARAAITLGDKQVTALVERHFGKLAPATAGEKQARIAWLNTALGRAKPGDPVNGKVLFTKHCAACHQLHGEGSKVGPDLTTADRKNRSYMLAQIVDPSGYIRPEYVVYSVLTKDERKLSGIVSESGESVVLTNVVNDQPVKTTVAKADIADLKPTPLSLMPEKLLDTLTEPQIADLFAYLASDAPRPTPPAPLPEGKGEKKKLTVALVSGSFEYKSDDSLAVLKKYLEATSAVECVLISAKAEKDVALAGLDQLEKCDAVVLFTRRLQTEGESLEFVKK
jgi:putative heme-binding domain-containing protein